VFGVYWKKISLTIGQRDLAAAQNLHSPISSPFLGMKLLYDYGLWGMAALLSPVFTVLADILSAWYIINN
jgi:hypothetical protein